MGCSSTNTSRVSNPIEIWINDAFNKKIKIIRTNNQDPNIYSNNLPVSSSKSARLGQGQGNSSRESEEDDRDSDFDG